MPVLLMLPARTRTLIAPGQIVVIDMRIRPKHRPVFGTTHRFPWAGPLITS